MKSRDGVNVFLPSLRWSNSMAPAIPLPVQDPSWPWLYMGGHLDRRSIELGSPLEMVLNGTAYRKSRVSGRSRTQPYPPCDDAVRFESFRSGPDDFAEGEEVFDDDLCPLLFFAMAKLPVSLLNVASMTAHVAMTLAAGVKAPYCG